MKAVLIFICLVAFATAISKLEENAETWKQWIAWKQKYGKIYQVKEEVLSYKTFAHNLQMINDHNKGSHSYTLGINQFADLTSEEFAL